MQGYDIVWGCDSHSTDSTAVLIWKPRAPTDYVALGYVCTTGAELPNAHSVRCVHRNAVAPSPHTQSAPMMTGVGSGIGDDGISVWITDDAAHTFVASRGSQGLTKYGDAWMLDIIDTSHARQLQTRSKPFTVHLTSNRICLQVRSPVHQNLKLNEIYVGCFGPRLLARKIACDINSFLGDVTFLNVQDWRSPQMLFALQILLVSFQLLLIHFSYCKEWIRFQIE